MKRKMDARNLSGYFIYRDDKERTYYSFPNSQQGYLINNSDAYTYYLFQIRPMAATAIVLLSIVLDPSYWKAGLIIGIVFYIITTLIFYFFFLKKLPLVKDLHKPLKQGYVAEQAENSSIGKLIAMSLLALLLTGLFIFVLIKGPKLTYLQMTLIAIIVIGYGLYGLGQFLALIRKLKSR